jgi:hypothetical protein
MLTTLVGPLFGVTGTAFAGRRATQKGTAMKSGSGDRFQVSVQMAEPSFCLWEWVIRDTERQQVLESSWTSGWIAYDSAEEAYRAGGERLRALKAA